jgi:PPOX class probable F420-dependent enzyme
VTAEEARRRFASARIAHLASADTDGVPHLVAMVFALVGATVYSAVDDKPKRTRALRRLANVEVNPSVAVLVDHYDEHWDELWWVRAEGRGRVLDGESPEARAALAALAARYSQYRERPPGGPVLAVDVERWSSWSAAAD